MKKEYLNNKSPKKLEKLTGAARGVTVAALSTLIVGSCAYQVASIECNTNHSANAICPITRLETALFGVERGLQHQAHDLENYSMFYQDRKEYTSDVIYEPGTDESAPTVTFNKIYEYSDSKEVETKTWTYIDGKFVQITEQAPELTKKMK